MPDPTSIDPAAIAALNDLNPGDGGGFLREIVGIYVEDTPRRLQDLRSSLAAGDAPLFTRAAHTIKGSSANVGAVVLARLAERLEAKARKEGLADVAELLAECEAEFARTAAELRKIAS
jgi:HPt (histidine-containing phosphotransfer) domain-containing protein